MLRFHPHPSQCRSIGQAIGLTAYPPQRAAIFTTQSLTRTCLAYFGWEPYSSLWTSRPHVEPTVPSGIVSFGPADPVCARHLSCKGSLTPRPEVGSLRSRQFRSLTRAVTGSVLRPPLEPKHNVAAHTIGAQMVPLQRSSYHRRDKLRRHHTSDRGRQTRQDHRRAHALHEGDGPRDLGSLRIGRHHLAVVVAGQT